MKKIAIYGAGGLGKEILTLIRAINVQEKVWNFVGFFDDGVDGPNILGGKEKLNSWNEDLFLVIGIGNPLVKKEINKNITNTRINFATLIHPGTIIGDPEKIKIGEGSLITAGTIMTTDITIGTHTLINLKTTIGHDTHVGNYCSVMPGVNLAGNVNLEECVFIGAGANVLNGITIGTAAKIGAGALVNRDVLKDTTAVGVPARPLKL